jgi:hypothetical protein
MATLERARQHLLNMHEALAFARLQVRGFSVDDMIVAHWERRYCEALDAVWAAQLVEQPALCWGRV